MDDKQTTKQEGDAPSTEEKKGQAPTPADVMPDQDSAPKADPEPQEAATLSVEELGELVGREFDSPEAAKKWVKEVNSYVGDQTRAKKDKALEKLASQAGLSTDELLEVIDTQDVSQPTMTNQSQQTPPTPQAPDVTTIRVTRMEVDNLLDKHPEASAIKDKLLAEALNTGKTAREIWDDKYAPILEAGKKLGAKKLQSNLEGQPGKAASTAQASEDTKIDFSGINPETGRRWTSQEMERHLGYKETSPGL